MTLKSCIAAIAGCVIVWLLCYFIGAFIAADFNIARWSREGRIFIGAVGGVLGMLCATAAGEAAS